MDTPTLEPPQRAAIGTRYLTDARLRAIANSLPDLVFVLSREGHYLDALETHPELIALPASGRLIGGTVHDTHPPATAQAVLRAIAETLESGKPQSLEYELRVPVGMRWFEAVSAPLIATPSRPDAVVWIARDVTRRKQVELEREHLIAELDAFGHTVAHDLKNPLQLMLGYLSVMLEDEASMSPDERRTAFEQMQVAAGKMNNIIDGLMLLSGVRQMAHIPTTPLDMRALIVNAQEMVRHHIERHQAVISVPNALPAALGYAPWVEEVWTNYLSNAIKYGGRPPRVLIGCDAPKDGLIRYWVRDNGAGIPAETLPHLFTPFTRAKEARSMGQGYGLGLSIVLRIVERLGGAAGADSTLGEGSTFWFTLPTV